MGDRIVVMRNGHIEQVGAPSDVYDRPTNRFVADFIGNPSMNFVDVELSGTRLQAPFLTVDVPGAADLPPGPYTLGVRPEDVALTGGDDPEATATVTVVEPTGSEAVVYLDVGGAELTANVPRPEAPDSGAEVGVRIPPAAVYLFDAETGTTVYGGKERAAAEN